MASRALGFTKATLLVYAIGGTSSAVGGQAFDIANSIPTYLYGLIAGGVLGAILVPQMVRAIADGEEGRRVLERLLTITFIAAVALTTVLTLCAPVLVRAYALGWPESWVRLATLMAYWCLPQIFFFVAYSVLSQLLNAHESFGWAAWAPAAANLVAVAGLGSFLCFGPSGLGTAETWSGGMIAWLCGSATLGIALQAAMLIPAARATGFRFRFRLGIRGLGAVSRMAGWTLCGLLAGQLANLVVTNAAATTGRDLSTAGVDGPSANSLSAAYLLLLLPHGILVVSMAAAMFTRLSHAAARADQFDFETNLARTSCFTGMVTAAALTVFFVGGPMLTDILWGTPVIGEVLRWLALSLPGFSLAYVANRALFAVQSGRSVAINQTLAAAITAGGTAVAAAVAAPEVRIQTICVAIAVASTASWLAAEASLTLHRRRIRASSAHRHPAAVTVTATTLAVCAAIAIGLVIESATKGWASEGAMQEAAAFALASGASVAVLGLAVGALHLTRRPRS